MCVIVQGLYRFLPQRAPSIDKLSLNCADRIQSIIKYICYRKLDRCQQCRGRTGGICGLQLSFVTCIDMYDVPRNVACLFYKHIVLCMTINASVS